MTQSLTHSVYCLLNNVVFDFEFPFDEPHIAILGWKLPILAWPENPLACIKVAYEMNSAKSCNTDTHLDDADDFLRRCSIQISKILVQYFMQMSLQAKPNMKYFRTMKL